MKIVLYGATGNSGQRILEELSKRGHDVTAVARNISKLPSKVKAAEDDLSNADTIASVIAGADVVVSAFAPPHDNTDALIVTERQIAAAKKAGVPRLIVVGGAGLLEVAPGVTLIASGYLPEAHPHSPSRMKMHSVSSRDRTSTGPTSARLHTSSPVSAPASTASERRASLPMRRVIAGYRLRTMLLRWPMRSKSLLTNAVSCPSATNPTLGSDL